MCDHDFDDVEETPERPWIVWRDAGAAYVEWTDIPITLFKIVEEVGDAISRIGGFACELFKAHANERSHRRFIHDEMNRELEQIVGGE